METDKSGPQFPHCPLSEAQYVRGACPVPTPCGSPQLPPCKQRERSSSVRFLGSSWSHCHQPRPVWIDGQAAACKLPCGCWCLMRAEWRRGRFCTLTTVPSRRRDRESSGSPRSHIEGPLVLTQDIWTRLVSALTQPPSSFLPGTQPMPPTTPGHCGYKMEQNCSVGAQERTSESPPWALLVLVPGLESRPGPPSCSPHLSARLPPGESLVMSSLLHSLFRAQSTGWIQTRSDTRLPPSWSLLQAQVSTPAPNPAHLLSSSRDR